MHTKFYLEKVNEGEHLEDLNVDGIQIQLEEKGYGDVKWIHVAQDMD
jgi:hypothetical protein